MFFDQNIESILHQQITMLEALITSKTRVKLLLKFFLNSTNTGYLRGLASEFNESTNSIRPELNRFEDAGLLTSSTEGMRKVFKANINHPLFSDLNSLVRKYVGMDDLIDKVINNLGDPREVYLIGDIAKGIDSDELNMVIVGHKIDIDYLEELVIKAQKAVSRKIGYIVFTPGEFELHYPKLNQQKLLRVWSTSSTS